MMKRVSLVLALLVVTIAGCGSSSEFEVARVEGQILLDGQPLADATVIFTPTSHDATRPAIGPDAIGKTDAEGRFQLVTHTSQKGATVGTNRVVVSTFRTEADPADPENGAKTTVVQPERVPPQFNVQSILLYEVPSNGTDSAVFQLQTS